MKTIETNDWVVVNSIIYRVYSTDNCLKMRSDFLEDMKMVLDFDSADFYVTSPDDSRKLVNPAMYNCDEDYSAVYERCDKEREPAFLGKSLVFRGTDFISDEEKPDSEFCASICRLNNWNYSLHMILSRKRELLGMVSFYRTIGKDNFDNNDIFLLDMLKNHIALRLLRDKENFEITHEKMTVTEACQKFSLTRQEHMILKLLMEGRDNNTICESLSISVNTLKKHILNIYRKLGIKNRVQMFKMIKEKE